MITAATPTDALAGGLVVLAVFIAGLYWQEETRALREMTQKIRTFTIALVAMLSELGHSDTRPDQSDESTSAARTLIPLVPGGLSTVLRCKRPWWKSLWAWASIIVLVLATGVAFSGGNTFDGYLAVLLLVVALALAIAHAARVPLHERATCAAETLQEHITKALRGGQAQGLLKALLEELQRELIATKCVDRMVQPTCTLELEEKLGNHLVHIAKVVDVADVEDTTGDLYARLRFGKTTSSPFMVSWKPNQLKEDSRVLVFLGGEPGKPNRVIGIVEHPRLGRPDSRPTPVTKQGATKEAWDFATPAAPLLLRNLWNAKVETIGTGECTIRSVLSEVENVMRQG